MEIVERNLLPNCPINRKDILAAEDIFGPDLGIIKGKTVRHTPDAVRPQLAIIPDRIMRHYHDVTLAADIMFVNRMPFFVTISRNIRFATSEMIGNQRGQTLLKAISQVISLYQLRGFRVTHILMDGQFESLRADLGHLGIMLNTAAPNEHVPEIERYIRTLKERVRCVYNTLPFRSMPGRMISELVYACTFWMNSFPQSDGISKSLSPRAIVTGQHIDYVKHCKLEFGDYVQTHDEHDNSLAPRTTGAIALHLTGNVQGAYYFMSLTTGQKIRRYRWTSFPCPMRSSLG